MLLSMNMKAQSRNNDVPRRGLLSKKFKLSLKKYAEMFGIDRVLKNMQCTLSICLISIVVGVKVIISCGFITWLIIVLLGKEPGSSNLPDIHYAIIYSASSFSQGISWNILGLFIFTTSSGEYSHRKLTLLQESLVELTVIQRPSVGKPVANSDFEMNVLLSLITWALRLPVMC